MLHGYPGIANPIDSWVLMSVAMMGPAALAGVRHTRLNSLRWRRGRAMTEFAAAYLAVWAIFGAVALTVVAALPGGPGTVALAIVLALAAAWQLTPLKRRWLRDCHRSVPLPPQGLEGRDRCASLRTSERTELSRFVLVSDARHGCRTDVPPRVDVVAYRCRHGGEAHGTAPVRHPDGGGGAGDNAAVVVGPTLV